MSKFINLYKILKKDIIYYIQYVKVYKKSNSNKKVIVNVKINNKIFHIFETMFKKYN